MKDRLYNKELKLAYINSYDGEESTKNTILFEFLKSAKIEKQYEKDLYAFHDREIDDLLYSLGWDNIRSLHKSVSIYKGYIDWCIANGQRGIYENRENRMEIFQATVDMSKYISNRKVKNRFLTKEELNQLIDSLINPIDQAFILCLYEFIGGRELHEIRSLKISDVDLENKKVKLTDIDGNTRIQIISTKLVELLKETNNTTQYYENNGEGNRVDGIPFIDTEYIFKMVNKGSGNEDMITYTGLYSKFRRIKKFTGFDLITINSIRESRIMQEISNVAKGRGLDKPDNDTYNAAMDSIYSLYGVKISYNQLYGIREKYKQLIELKDFD